MERLSYLGTFVSLILGLGVANVLARLSALVKRGRTADWYWLHTLWGLFLLFAMAGEWWILLLWERVVEIGFFAYLSLLLKPSILFFASDLLFPDLGAGSGAVDLRAHFVRVRRTLYLSLIGYTLADVLDTLLKGWAHFRGLGPLYPVVVAASVAMLLLGLTARDERVHVALAFFAFVGFGLGITNGLAALR